MTPKPAGHEGFRAVLIGVSSYRDEGFLPLPAAANSLKGLQGVLVDTQLCGWPSGRVTTVLNPADSRRLLASLRRWARDTEDVLLVYYVGHGTIAPDGELCLALTDTDFDDPDITGIEYRHIRSAIIDSPARIKVVILDCCYSGRAIQIMCNSEEVADLTDIRGTYVITSSDHAAHVPPLPQQTRECTSFTGELLDLIRTGIPGGPETLTLNMIYAHLRTRLHKCHLPAPNQRGTDTAAEFVFTRNAALLPYSIERFPRPEPPSLIRRMVRKPALVTAIVAMIIASSAFARLELGTPAPSCGSGSISGGTAAKGEVVVGSGAFPESELLGQIYADALKARGVAVTTDFGVTSREVYYPEVCDGQITVVPEYNGALLTTSVNPESKAVSTAQVDAALKAQLPPSLTILDPSPAQDEDSVTVTSATATRYRLASIADLRRVARNLVIGGPSEFQGREQGLVGLRRDYGLVFKSFQPVDDSGNGNVQALTGGQVQVADVFTTDPWIKVDHLVTLADPRGLFTAANIVPLVYKAGVDATVISTLDAISAKLTESSLRNLDTKIMIDNDNVASVASGWVARAGLGS